MFKRRMSRRTQSVLGVLVAVVLVVWFLRRADLPRVANLLGAADLRFVALACLTVAITSLQRARRWQQLLAPLGRYAIRDLWAAILMGWSVSVLLPGRLGEVARPVFLARRAPIAASAALGSVVLERVFDVVAILTLLAGYLLWAPAPTAVSATGVTTMAVLRSVGMGLLAALALVGMVAVAAARNEPLRRRVEGMVERMLPAAVAGILVSFLTGMSGLRSRAAVAQVLLSSVVLWGTVVSTYVLLFAALGLGIPWYGAIPLLTLLVVGAAVPTPAAVGAFHKVAQIGLVGLFGVDNDTAVAYAIIGHAVAFLPLAAVGLILIVRGGLASEALRGMQDVATKNNATRAV